jgi:hypothetical protein
MATTTADLGQRLVRAIELQDEAELARCFAPDATVRALIPPGLRERDSGEEAAALIAGWFADSTALELRDVHVCEVGDRLHLSYRFEGVEEGVPYVVEQQAFCTARGDVIAQADLVCSGFRPRPGAAA